MIYFLYLQTEILTKKLIEIMKKLFLSLVAFAICSTASAQNAQQKEAINNIRERYSSVLEWTKEMKEMQETNNCCTIVINRVLGGSGPQEKKIELFFSNDDSRDNGWGWLLTFARVSYNYAARNYYEEYLFAEEKAEPIFAYRLSDEYISEMNKDVKQEERLYINDAVVYYENKILDLEGKLLKTNKASELNEDNSWATATAESIKNLFDQVVNKVY